MACLNGVRPTRAGSCRSKEEDVTSVTTPGTPDTACPAYGDRCPGPRIVWMLRPAAGGRAGGAGQPGREQDGGGAGRGHSSGTETSGHKATVTDQIRSNFQLQASSGQTLLSAGAARPPLTRPARSAMTVG